MLRFFSHENVIFLSTHPELDFHLLDKRYQLPPCTIRALNISEMFKSWRSALKLKVNNYYGSKAIFDLTNSFPKPGIVTKRSNIERDWNAKFRKRSPWDDDMYKEACEVAISLTLGFDSLMIMLTEMQGQIDLQDYVETHTVGGAKEKKSFSTIIIDTSRPISARDFCYGISDNQTSKKVLEFPASNIDRSNIERSNIERSNIERSNIVRSNIGRSNIDRNNIT